MKSRKIMFLSFLLICILSCNNRQKEQPTNEIDSNKKLTQQNSFEIKRVLQRQLIKGSSGLNESSFDEETYNYTIKDLEATLPILNQALKKNNYSQIDDQKFKNKVQEIFGRLINPSSNKHLLCINFEDKCSRETLFHRNDYSIEIRAFVMYIVKDQNFITELYAIPEIINYQKEYPDLIDFENQTSEHITKNGNHYITISKWKDVTDLLETRENNIQTLVNRNKYLFNDNIESLAWLKTHDEFFLESLVKTFGYVQDKNLLEWVINKNTLQSSKDNVYEFSKILWIRNCDNKIEIHKEVFELMLAESETNREKYKTSLLVFLDEIQDKKTDLSFSELTKIKALVCYYGTKMTNGSYYSFFSYMNREEYEEEFEKNNYYNISDFKKIYNETKYQGIWLPGMPE